MEFSDIWVGQNALKPVSNAGSSNFKFKNNADGHDTDGFYFHASQNTISAVFSGNSVTAISTEDPNAKQNDYYLLDLILNVASAPGKYRDSSTERGVFLRTITVTAEPKSQSGVQTEQSIPSTFVGSTTNSSSISGSVSGSVGFFGDSPTGTLNGTVGYTKSVSYVDPDITVTNLSSGDVAKWQLDFAEPQPSVGDIHLSEMCIASVSSVSPEFCWVWNADTDNRPQGSAVFEFTVTVVCEYKLRKVEIPLAGPHTIHDPQDASDPIVYQVQMNYAQLPSKDSA